MRSLRNIFFISAIISAWWPLLAQASNMPFNENVNLGVGIGTTMVSNAGLTVMSGNVGIGTWVPAKSLSVNGDTYHNGNIGIGTSFVGGTGEAALAVMNGNVGIGTWVPTNTLTVGASMPNDATSIAHFSGAVAVWPGSMNGWPNTRTTLSLGVTGGNDNYFSMGIAGTNTTGIGMSNAGNNMMFVNQSGPIQFKTGVTYNGDWNTTGAVNMQFATSGNVGVGTTLPSSALSVGLNGLSIGANYTNGVSAPGNGLAVQGNVGVGTWTANSALQVVGNVGIGSTAPNGALDVGGGSICLGHTCYSNWTSSGTNYWLNDLAGNVGISTIYAVGIGTSFVGGTGEAALAVMNGNVGIGTWVPADTFQVGKYSSNSSGFEIDSNGNVGMGTTMTSNRALSIMSGSVGIGTWVPGTNLDVVSVMNGDTGSFVRQTTNGASSYQIGNLHLAMTGTVGIGLGDGLVWDLPDSVGNVDHSGMISSYWVNNISGSAQSAMAFNLYIPGGPQYSTAAMTIFPGGGNGYVGIGTWSPGKPLSVNGDTYLNGNIGVGTTFVGGTGEAALAVMNGNVGIGTWVPAGALDIKTGNNVLVESGNVGIGTTNPQGGLVVTNGNVGIGTWTTVGGNLIVNGGGNVGISSAWPGTTLDVNGTVRATAMLIGANNVCQSTGTNCPAGGTNPWLVVQAAGNVGITTTRSVGIGTTSAGAGAGLLVMNGNVGIGTWAPAGIFQVNNSTSSPLTVTSSGNVGIGTTTPQGGLVIVNGNVGIGTWTTVGGTLIVQMGNVGIGTVNPGQMLDVNGAIRSTLTGISNFSGNVGINSTNPGTDLDINGGRARFLGIGTTVPGSILCLKTDGTIGYCTGIVSGYQCTTCN